MHECCPKYFNVSTPRMKSDIPQKARREMKKKIKIMKSQRPSNSLNLPLEFYSLIQLMNHQTNSTQTELGVWHKFDKIYNNF